MALDQRARGPIQEAFGEAALVFLVGGLTVLAGIVVLVALQTLVPRSKTSGLAEPAERQLRPVTGGSEPQPASPSGKRRSGRPVPVARPRIDQAMDHIVTAGLGEPRILRSVGGFTVARLYGCRGCARGAASPEGCHFERDAVEYAFRNVYGQAARVRETVCRRWGGPECEFEVRH